MAIDTMKNRILAINDALSTLGYSIYYDKINYISDNEYIVILFNNKKPIKKGAIDKIDNAVIEVDYVSNQVPEEMFAFYDKCALIESALISKGFDVINVKMEVSDTEIIIHFIVEVSVKEW